MKTLPIFTVLIVAAVAGGWALFARSNTAGLFAQTGPDAANKKKAADAAETTGEKKATGDEPTAEPEDEEAKKKREESIRLATETLQQARKKLVAH